jgi:hypothetical protein
MMATGLMPKLSDDEMLRQSFAASYLQWLRGKDPGKCSRRLPPELIDLQRDLLEEWLASQRRKN